MIDQPLVLIKYGGNAMLSDELKKQVVRQVSQLFDEGYQLVLVHGGGPFIKNMLELVKIDSEFIGGHRKTSPKAMKYIEMTLKGEVNGSLVNLLNRAGLKAVGLSGKDGRMAVATKRVHKIEEQGREVSYDLGQVGDVEHIDTTLITTLLAGGYLPVVTCIASDEAGEDYNINADMFAGHLAGALNASHYLVLTDVDGLLKDISDPESIIQRLNVKELSELYGTTIKGGMIPKLESCTIALEGGASKANIINGTKPESISDAVKSKNITGTEICL